MRYVISLGLLLFTAVALCQKAYTPKVGSPERKAIMDALRVPIQKTLKKKVVFKANHFKVLNGWAFVYGEPLQQNGKPMDYKGTQYQEAIDLDMFDSNFCGLLKKQGKKWIVKDWRLGMTDVGWEPWSKQYGAPRSIFP